MLKRKIETPASQAKRLKTCSETAALPDACKGSCSGWESSGFVTVPNSTRHRQVLRDSDNTIISIENRVISTDAWAGTKHSRRSSTACAAEGAADTSRRGSSYQPTAGGFVSRNGIIDTGNEIGSLSAAQAATGHYSQGFQGSFSDAIAAQQQPAAASASLEVQRAASQESDITNDHQVMLGSCLLQPPMTSKGSSCQHSPDHQVKNNSNGSSTQTRGLAEQCFTETRTVNQPSMPISRPVVETVNYHSVMTPIGYLPTYQQHLLSDNLEAPAAAAAAVISSTPGVPPHSAAVEPKPFFSSTAATAIEAAPTIPVAAQPAFSSPLPVWGRRAPRSKLVNITNTMTDPGRHHHQQQQRQQQQQQCLVTPDDSASARKSHRDMQHPKRVTRSASRRQLSSGSAVGAASMVKAGVQKRSTRSTRSAASSSKRQSLGVHQAKADRDAAADVWASGDAAAAMCSNATATAAAAGINYAVPTAAAAAANSCERLQTPPVTHWQPSEMNQSAVPSTSADAKIYESAYNDFQIDGGMFDLEGYDFAEELPSFELDENAHIDEVAAMAEAAAELVAATMETTVTAAEHEVLQEFFDSLLNENVSISDILDHEGSSNGTHADGGLGDVSAAATAAAYEAKFSSASFDPVTSMYIVY